MSNSNKGQATPKAATSKAVVNELSVKVIEAKNNTVKTVVFTDKEPLTKQFAQFTDIQNAACELHCQGIIAKIPGKSATNRAERNFAMLDFALSVAFNGVENRATVLADNWIAKNLSKKFKVSALSANAFRVAIGHVKGLYRDMVKKQRLETEVINADVIKTRKLLQSEMKQLVSTHKAAIALPATA